MSANTFLKSYSSKLGFHKGTSRIWIESKKLEETKLANNMSYEPIYDFENNRIILKPGSSHKITTKKKNKTPVIDLLNKSVEKIFKGFEHIVINIYGDEIIIEPLREEIQQKRAKSKSYNKIPTMIEICSGGGTLVKALRDAGVKPVAAVELEDKYLVNTEANNPDIKTYCGDLAKLDSSLLPFDADAIVTGLPCEGYSSSQTGELKEEEHPTGSLGFYVLKIIEQIRPAVVVIEEVPRFKKSAMASMARFVLTSMGYEISETFLKGSDYGALTKRNRYCMVASIKKGFSFDDSYKRECNRVIQDILEIPLDKREWLTSKDNASIATFERKEAENIAKGKGFRIGKIAPSEKDAATITKDYYKCRMTDPILIHPDNPNMYSFFTPRELARINGLPEDFKLTGTKTTDGQIIGQGVCYEAFNAVGKMIVNHFHAEEYDKEKEKLIDFKKSINNINYSDEELTSFMNGSLFS